MPRPSQPARATTIAVAPIVAVGVLAACSSSKTSGSPAATSGARAATVTVTADKGCTPDRTSFDAGGITFTVTNKDATGVTEVEVLSGERIIGEKENLPPGFSGSFSITANAGTYTLYCPGAKVERTTLTVTGTAANADDSVAALLKTGTTAYAKYVTEQVGYLLQAVRALDAALRGTDVAAAQVAYIKARPFYEKIEPVAESFTIGSDSVDADIDARENDVPAAQWKGFHRIEKGLFVTKSLAGLATYGTGLVADVKKLQGLVATLTYQPTELANGAQELLDEVAASKITGEEERYSHIDMLDIDYNVEGALQAFSQLQPALEKIDKTLSDQIVSRFDALDKLIDTFRDAADASGFVRYEKLTTADKHDVAAAVKAVQEPLSRVGNKVAG